MHSRQSPGDHSPGHAPDVQAESRGLNETLLQFLSQHGGGMADAGGVVCCCSKA